MRFFIRFTLLLTLLFPQCLPAQNADSMARAVDSSARAIEQSAKAIQRWQDSIEREKVFRNLDLHGQSLDDFLQEMRAKEEKRKRQVYIRIGLGALLLTLLIAGLIRRRRRKS